MGEWLVVWFLFSIEKVSGSSRLVQLFFILFIRAIYYLLLYVRRAFKPPRWTSLIAFDRRQTE